MHKMSVFSNQLIKWYRLNHRQLPWRETVDPYKIWISEVLMQQTRVAQGLPYYEKFIQRFPTVEKMAKAKQDEILQLWQGLGYYSRARNMHFTAQEVIRLHNGKFPSKYDELIILKGIGEYTASAISSFSINEKRAAVDGNVYRVISRFFGIEEAIDSTSGKKIFKEKADEIISIKFPGIHNQAMMEFGATVCLPRNPLCENCIFSKECVANLTGKTNELPFKSKKTKVSQRFLTYLVFHDSENTLLKKRDGKDIWQGLFDFPLVETKTEKLSSVEKKELEILLKKFKVINQKPEIVKVKHILSHRELRIEFRIYHLKKMISVDGYQNFELKKKKFPGVPQVIMKLLEDKNWFSK
jgi:A/G-specific adenine glycosylase